MRSVVIEQLGTPQMRLSGGLTGGGQSTGGHWSAKTLPQLKRHLIVPLGRVS